METMNVEYQTHSLIEFLLGDGVRPGWFDKQSYSRTLSRTAMAAAEMTNAA